MGSGYMGRSVLDACRNWSLTAVVLAGLAGGTSEAGPSADKSEPSTEALFGSYLAGRHAQHTRDYGAAAGWFEEALRADPESPELITRTFLMEVSVGQFERARILAKKEL